MPIRSASLLVLALAAGACDTTFEGRGEMPEEVAAVYGVLDARASVQTVRLEAVRTEPERPPVPPTLQADLVREATGVRTPGAVRLVPLGDGSQARLAAFALGLMPGESYRLDVRDAAGHTGSARAVVPPVRAMQVQAPRRDSLRITQGVLVQGLEGAPAGVTLRYHLVITVAPSSNFGDTTSVVLQGDVGEPASGGWRVAADPQRDAPVLLARAGGPPIERVRLVRVTVEVTERSAEAAYAAARQGPHFVRLLGAFSALGASRVTFVPAAEVIRAAGLRP